MTSYWKTTSNDMIFQRHVCSSFHLRFHGATWTDPLWFTKIREHIPSHAPVDDPRMLYTSRNIKNDTWNVSKHFKTVQLSDHDRWTPYLQVGTPENQTSLTPPGPPRSFIQRSAGRPGYLELQSLGFPMPNLWSNLPCCWENSAVFLV